MSYIKKIEKATVLQKQAQNETGLNNIIVTYTKMKNNSFKFSIKCQTEWQIDRFMMYMDYLVISKGANLVASDKYRNYRSCTLSL